MESQQIDKNDLYPMVFQPVYKQTMWAGVKMQHVLGRQTPGFSGEALDICDRPGMESMVQNGKLAGVSINRLVKMFGSDFVGASFNGDRFPVIVKMIDAGRNLSLQVHPNEEAQQKLKNGSEPKYEMWYVLDSNPHAKIYAGLNNSSSHQKFIEMMDSPDIVNSIQCFESIPGDAYFINAGRVHFIGAGNLILEVSSNSTTSYRVTDWGRIDKNTGRPRQLHKKEALESINFLDKTTPRIAGASNTAEHNRKYPLVNRCSHFHCDDLKLVAPWCDTTEAFKSFHILTAVNSPIAIENRRFRTNVPFGYSVLIPACFGEYTVVVIPGTTTTVIRTTMAL